MEKIGDRSITYQKSKKFAVRIVMLCKYLRQEKKDWDISDQIIRSGTSIGAKLAEALYGSSKRDFLAKVSISLKEAHETQYWLELLYETSMINEVQFTSLNNDCEELIRLFAATVRTTSNRLGRRIAVAARRTSRCYFSLLSSLLSLL